MKVSCTLPRSDLLPPLRRRQPRPEPRTGQAGTNARTGHLLGLNALGE